MIKFIRNVIIFNLGIIWQINRGWRLFKLKIAISVINDMNKTMKELHWSRQEKRTFWNEAVKGKMTMFKRMTEWKIK